MKDRYNNVLLVIKKKNFRRNIIEFLVERNVLKEAMISILHDEKPEPHYHVWVRFNGNSVTMSLLCSLFRVNPTCVCSCNLSKSNVEAYLSLGGTYPILYFPKEGVQNA